MPNNTDPGNGHDWELAYNGLIDLTNSQTVITMVPDGFARVVAGSFDATTNKQVIMVDHNGSIGDVAVTIKNDGNLGTDDFPILITETFSMLALPGATAVTGIVGAQRPTV